MSNQKTQVKLNRDEKARRKAILKEQQKHPLNQFLNAVDKDGNVLYEIAPKLMQYFRSNPDPVLDAMEMSNALLHEIRWHKKKAQEYHVAYISGNVKEMKDNHGRIMDKDDCYIHYISETQVNHTVLSKLRVHLINKLLITVDDDIFTFQQFNDYVLQLESILKEMGYVLFPDKVEVIKPL